MPGRGLPANPALLSARVMSGIARYAEDADFDAVALDEHPAPPQAWRQHGDGHDAVDPFVGLAGDSLADAEEGDHSLGVGRLYLRPCRGRGLRVTPLHGREDGRGPGAVGVLSPGDLLEVVA
jgi:hypothetical protein